MNILLIHGLFGSLSYPQLLHAFASSEPSATVLAPDLLGYGENRHANTADLSLTHQVNHLVSCLHEAGAAPVHVVGHSVGGAVGLLLASDYPDLVESYTSVEGNMTLKDAFWSAEIASKPTTTVESIIMEYKADVAAWLKGAGVSPTPERLRIAEQWLDFQPASTIKAQARAVVEATGKSDYLRRFERLKNSDISVNLIAGEHSLEAWDLPATVQAMSNSMTSIANCGHLMMLEQPNRFANVVYEQIR